MPATHASKRLVTITVWAAQKRVDVSRARAYVWLREGRLRGARQVAGRWLIPLGAKKPEAHEGGRPRATAR